MKETILPLNGYVLVKPTEEFLSGKTDMAGCFKVLAKSDDVIEVTDGDLVFIARDAFDKSLLNKACSLGLFVKASEILGIKR